MNGNRKTGIRHFSFWERVGLWKHQGLEVPDDTFEDAFVYKSKAPNRGVMHPGPLGAKGHLQFLHYIEKESPRRTNE